MKKISQEKLILLCIIVIAALFRFTGLNWDSNYHLHPDERFLTMVTVAMQLPATIAGYLDPQTSLMHPKNIGFQFYVYGLFPLVFTKILAVWQSLDTYNLITLLGRFLTGIFDLITLVGVYKVAKLFFPKTSVPRLAAFFYAIAVLPIQLAHFYAVDTFLTTFTILSFYFMAKYALQESVDHRNIVQKILHQDKNDAWMLLKPLILVLFSAASLGLAIASKINAILFLPLIGIFLAIPFFFKKTKQLELDLKAGLKQLPSLFGYGLVFAIVLYLTVRFGSPNYFATANFLDLRLDPTFVESVRQLKSWEGPDVWFPPAIQWIPTQPILFSLKNLIVFGLGIPYAILMFSGIFLMVRQIAMQKKQATITDFMVLMTILWVIGFFLYQSTQFVKALRYFIFLYPFYALFAGYACAYLFDYLDAAAKKKHWFRYAKLTSRVVVFAAVLIWPLMFISIYKHPHSRVTASEWMYKNIPDQSILLVEHWDDALPLPMENSEGKTFIFREMPVFGMDNDEKWQQMNINMQNGDYYVMSSNRGWGSMPQVPWKYPLQTQFYEDLFAEKLGYRKVAEFTSYPRLELFGKTIFELPDDWADEPFTVYDHPKVMIYENVKK
ncbi:MAG: ArnT family glycosyltransferase [Weeksellaceae bacterium]